VRVVVERHRRELELAMPLDVHRVRAVDEYVRHAGIGEQRLEGTEAEHLVLDIADQASALEVVDDEIFFVEHPLHHRAQFILDPLGRQRLHHLEVEAVEESRVDADLQLLVRTRVRRCRAHGRKRRDLVLRRFDLLS
jgi:hypothetical protein